MKENSRRTLRRLIVRTIEQISREPAESTNKEYLMKLKNKLQKYKNQYEATFG